MIDYDVIIVGGGASGFFTAINMAEQNAALKILILEKNKEVLSKVKISGGGRCNVTHACFVPGVLVKYYPRGERELRGPFHAFSTGDMMEWLEKKGVELKIEDDGRVFPVSDNSQTIINCFLREAENLGVEIKTSCGVKSIEKIDNQWLVQTSEKEFKTNNLVVASGSSPQIWKMMKAVGHTIIPPVPSLFTFNIPDKKLHQLMGNSVSPVVLKIKNSKLTAEGALLITHWGLSGPAILRLSAWGARELATCDYRFTLQVNWLNGNHFDEVLTVLQTFKNQHPKKAIGTKSPFDFTQRVWKYLVESAEINPEKIWTEIAKKQLVNLTNQLIQTEYEVNGKSTFKDEFVTAGGIDLKEVNFKTMESKLDNNLYFTGEILNIDAITGGFNFQNAWTTGFLAAQAIAEKR